MSALVLVDDPLAYLEKWRVSRGFGVVTPGLERYGIHTGIDSVAIAGTPVYALEGGVVSLDDDDARFDPGNPATWSGVAVRIRHDDDAVAWYAHLSSNLVAVGQRIPKGGLIGYVGATGAATGAHLHWQVDVDAKPVDPLAYYRSKPAMPPAAITRAEFDAHVEDTRTTDEAIKDLVHFIHRELVAKGVLDQVQQERIRILEERVLAT